MHSRKEVCLLTRELREVERLDQVIARNRNAARIAKRFEAMNDAQVRQARRQLHVSVGLALLAFVILLATFHDAPARTAATVLEAEAQGGW